MGLGKASISYTTTPRAHLAQAADDNTPNNDTASLYGTLHTHADSMTIYATGEDEILTTAWLAVKYGWVEIRVDGVRSVDMNEGQSTHVSAPL